MLSATFIQQESLPTWLLPRCSSPPWSSSSASSRWFALIKPAVEDTGARHDRRAAGVDEQPGRQGPDHHLDAPGPDDDGVVRDQLRHPDRLPAGRHRAGRHSQTFSKSFDQDFALTDYIVQNPDGATGTVQIMRNSDVLDVMALENIRDDAQHLVAPYVFEVGDTLVVKVVCTVGGATDPSGCQINTSFSGFEP